MPERVTLEFVVETDEAKAKVNGLLTDMEGGVTRVGNKMTGWEKFVKNTGRELMTLVAAGGGIAMVVKGVQSITNAWEDVKRTRLAALGIQKTATQARAEALENRPGGVEGSEIDAMIKRVRDTSKGGVAIDEATAWKYASVAMSAMGGATMEQVENVIKESLRRNIRTGSDDPRYTVGMLSAGRLSGFTDARAMQGMVLQDKQASFVTDTESFAENVMPTALKLHESFGIKEEHAREIAAIFTHGMVDPTGAQSGTAALNFIGGLLQKPIFGGKFMPNEFRGDFDKMLKYAQDYYKTLGTKEKDDFFAKTGLSQYFEGVDDGTEEEIERIEGIDPAKRSAAERELMKNFNGRAKSRAFMSSLLGGEEEAMKIVKRTRSNITGGTEAYFINHYREGYENPLYADPRQAIVERSAKLSQNVERLGQDEQNMRWATYAESLNKTLEMIDPMGKLGRDLTEAKFAYISRSKDPQKAYAEVVGKLGYDLKRGNIASLNQLFTSKQRRDKIGEQLMAFAIDEDPNVSIKDEAGEDIPLEALFAMSKGGTLRTKMQDNVVGNTLGNDNLVTNIRDTRIRGETYQDAMKERGFVFDEEGNVISQDETQFKGVEAVALAILKKIFELTGGKEKMDKPESIKKTESSNETTLDRIAKATEKTAAGLETIAAKQPEALNQSGFDSVSN